jgi:hypothetical protein
MRISMIFGLVCAALALSGCDNDQPLDSSSVGGDGNATVNIVATATVPIWNVWSWTEDADGNGQLDNERDLSQGNCNFSAPNCTGPKPNGDGRLDSGEDLNNNGVLDPGEDLSGNGLLNLNEDFLIENGQLDAGEDLNRNCVRDAGEPDTNGDGILNREDADCDGWLDQTNEDRNRNGQRDLEDIVEINSAIDSGIWCEPTGLAESASIPVPVAGEVLLYHANDADPEVLADLGTSGGTNFTGLTPYDDRVRSAFPNKTVSFAGAPLALTNGQQLAASAQRVMRAPLAKSPGNGTDRPSYAGLCTVGFDFGTPNLGVPLPILTTVAAGDTFSIRLQSAAPGTFSTIEGADGFAVGGSVVRNGVVLLPRGSSSGGLGESVVFSVAVP